MTTEPQTVPKAKPASRTANAIAGVATLFMLAWIGLVCTSPDDNGPVYEESTSSATRFVPTARIVATQRASAATRILATTEEFIAGLEELMDGTVVARPTNEGGVRHMWNSSSFPNNWAQFWDDDSDGAVDLIQIGVGIPSNDDARILESLFTVHRIVETAGKVPVDGPALTKWVQESMQAATNEVQTHQFGRVLLRMNAMGANGGVILLFGIGGGS